MKQLTVANGAQHLRYELHKFHYYVSFTTMNWRHIIPQYYLNYWKHTKAK